MSVDTYKRVVDTFRHAVNISIVGDGEPLLNPDFLEMVAYARCVRRARVTILTNGLLGGIDPDQLIRSGLDLISISLKGCDQYDYTRMTGADSSVFGDVVANTHTLTERRNALRARTTIAVSFILDKNNCDKVREMLDLSESLGVDLVKFDPFLPLDADGLRFEDRCVTTSDFDTITVLRRHAGEKRPFDIRPPTVLDLHKPDAFCDSSFKVMRVSTDGRVSGCLVNLRELRSDRRFDEENIWNNEYFRGLRSSFIQGDHIGIPSACRQCYEYCGIKLW